MDMTMVPTSSAWMRGVRLAGFMLAAVALASVTSCASTPPRAENQAFTGQTGTNLVFIERGLYSVASSFDDKDVKRLLDGLMDNRVVLLVDDSISARATIEDDGKTLTIRIRNVMAGWDVPSRNVYLVALLGTIAKLAGAGAAGTDPDALLTRFRDVARMYADSGYSIPGLQADPWFASGVITVVPGGIQ